MSEITWGPEIAVDGKRPAWLNDGEDVRCFTTVWHSAFLIPSHINWPIIRKIQLRSDHPHYAQQTPTSDVVGSSEQTEVVSVLVEALSAMLREATQTIHSTATADTINEARGALLRARALLPEPFDPDEAIAHELWALAQLSNGEGVADAVARITDCLRRGRALEKGETA